MVEGENKRNRKNYSIKVKQSDSELDTKSPITNQVHRIKHRSTFQNQITSNQASKNQKYQQIRNSINHEQHGNDKKFHKQTKKQGNQDESHISENKNAREQVYSQDA